MPPSSRLAYHLPPTLARIGLWLALPFILWLATQPVTMAAPFEGIDKVEHALTFLVLAWLTAAAHTAVPSWGRLLALFAYGGLIEAAQSTLPFRDASWGDMLANAGGLIAYFLISTHASRSSSTLVAGD